MSRGVYAPNAETLFNSAVNGFEDFTARLLAWTRWWNTEHRPSPLQGRTPLQA